MPIEAHPNWFYDFYPMYTLILGSFPPEKSKHSFPFYYPNKQNRFWNVLEQIAQCKLDKDISDVYKAVKERKQLMQNLHLGVENIGLKIIRKNNSSLDTNIKIIEYQDTVRIVRNHTELKRIMLSGFSAKNSAAQSFLSYIEDKKIVAKFPQNFQLKPQNTFEIYIENRAIECVILNSTSSASAVKTETLVQQFSQYILSK